MKTAIYMTEGVIELILTPESIWEKDVVDKFIQNHKNISVKKGRFYECIGGALGAYFRQGGDDESESLIFMDDQRKDRLI